MNSKQRIAIVLSALAVLVTLLVVVPVFGADATQRFPNSADTTKVVTWVKQGGNVLLEVTDADLNTGVDTTVLVYLECAQSENVVLDQFTSTTSTSTGVPAATSSAPITAPILDRNGDGVLTGADIGFVSETGAAVDVSLLGLGVSIVDGVNGIITIRCTNSHGTDDKNILTGSDGDVVRLVYRKGAVNRTASSGLGSVKVASDADAAGINVVLEETGSNTGIFRGTLRLRSTASTSTATCLTTTAGQCTAGENPSNQSAGSPAATSTRIADNTWSVGDLKINTADTILVSYVDGATGSTVTRSATIKAETTAPSFGNFSPAEGAASTVLQPTVWGDITDADSGVNTGSILVWFGRDTNADGTIDATTFEGISVATADKTAITGGFSIRQRITATLASDQTVYWWIIGTDNAGNSGVTDREPSTAAGVANPCDADAFIALGTTVGLTPGTSGSVKGCQPFSIKIDRTAPALATTNPATTGSFWDTTSAATNKTNNDPSKGKNTSIRVEFTEAIDASTVTASDFKVAGSTPVTAEAFAGAPKSVFLTVGALAPSDRPKVEVVGSIKDVAGNEMTIPVSVDPSTDGIAPALTVAVGTATRPVTNTKVSIQITSNENATNLTITTVRVGTLHTAGVTSTALVFTGGPKTFSAEASPADSGLYSVFAQASDLNSAANISTAGGSTVSALSLGGLILFEVDKGLPAPTFLPAAAGVDDRNAVVSINFANEGLEYGLNSAGANVVPAAQADYDAIAAGTDLDNNGTVTLTKVTLDGSDITSMVSSVDNIQFLYKAAGGLTVGSHTVVVDAKDVAGNTKTFTHTFKINDRAAFSLPLNPGWNMISFPGTPANAAIDAVIGNTPVTVVMAYDSSSAARWKVATRTRKDDGTFTAFTGTLTAIDPKLGYWVSTDTFQAISTLIPRMAGGAATGETPVQPPAVNIMKGWNLVPVIDTTGDKMAGDNIAVGTYFSGLTTSRIYTFDTLNGKWVAVTANVQVGKSYWVYATANGTLVP